MSEASELFSVIAHKLGVTILVSEVGTLLISRSCCAHGGLTNDDAYLLMRSSSLVSDCDNPFYTGCGSSASQDRASAQKLETLRKWAAMDRPSSDGRDNTPFKCGDCWYGAFPCVPDRRGVRGPSPKDNYYGCR